MFKSKQTNKQKPWKKIQKTDDKLREEIVVNDAVADGVLLGILTEFFRLKKKGPITQRKVDKRQDVLQFPQSNLKITRYRLSHVWEWH